MHGGYTMAGVAAVYPRISAIAGPAVTVSAHEGGFAIVKMALHACGPGDVLVVSTRGPATRALWGGNLSLGAQRRGVAGLVIDGAVRDVHEISDLGFPVFATGVATGADPLYSPYGEVNVPISCGGIPVHPGDVVVADEDGIVAVRPRDATAVIAAARAVVAGHEAVQPLLRAGEVTRHSEIEQALLADGLAVIDQPWN
jgi:regulator of RNase E activity RraA